MTLLANIATAGAGVIVAMAAIVVLTCCGA